MLVSVLSLITFFGVAISDKSTLKWNIGYPYKYNGYIYSDSKVVIINPAIQIKINNNEEICNFYINYNITGNNRFPPFRVVVKSAHLGLGEIILKPKVNLDEWKNKEIIFSILAEACHDPDKWSIPAYVSIKVFDPPGPLWTQNSYNVLINNNIQIGTILIKVTAYLPSWTNVDNKICRYFIKSPMKSPFYIDGGGTIKLKERLKEFDYQYFTLVVVAEDCSQPIHRQSKVNVFISLKPTCQLGWTGFYTLLNYKSGIKYLSKNPRFELCDYTMTEDSSQMTDTTIKDCVSNKTLRLTTSVEIKAEPMNSLNINKDHKNNCKLDFDSLKLQREVCGINESKMVELLIELNGYNTGALIFPIQGNIFPVTSIVMDNKFSFYFWMKRAQSIETTEEYIICQIDDIGNNIFSVSLRKCVIQIQLRSYKSKYIIDYVDQSIPTVWIFNVVQACDNKWHHIAILASRANESPFYSELSIFIDGDMMDYTNDNPDIILNSPLQRISSNITEIFFGQCPKLEKTEFKGVLAGVVFIPGTILTSSKLRCLTKCSERLFFNGMNQMNPGMSVSLNSEMQMIIINGHNIDEVRRLIKVIGFVNPTFDNESKERKLIIETEMSCGKKTFNIPTKIIRVKINQTRAMKPSEDILTFISLLSSVTTILIPDSTQANSDMGTGIIVFANTSLEITGIPHDTNTEKYDVLRTISKCVITIIPKLRFHEYLEWPPHLLKVVSGDKYSIKVSNTSKVVIFQGLHNEQVYQFVIQHLRYFSTPEDHSVKQTSKTFQLQCFSYIGMNVIKSNIINVKVIIWYNNKVKEIETTLSSIDEKSTLRTVEILKNNFSYNNIIRNDVPLHAQSNVALMSELETSSRSSNNTTYNILLGFGLVILICILIVFIKRSQKNYISVGRVFPYRIMDRICFPLQIIKEKIKPSPSVRVELSRNYNNFKFIKERSISLEMEWDDIELNNGLNIISNPMCEKTVEDIDDSSINKDVPPNCENEDSEDTEDDIYEDFTKIYAERNETINKIKKK